MSRTHLQALLLSRDQTAEMLGVSGLTLWRWHKKGFLTPLTAGGRIVAYLRGDVEKIKHTPAYLDRLKPGRRKKEASA
jgi:predicted DNA-binding transcriptional regulator AlpA